MATSGTSGTSDADRRRFARRARAVAVYLDIGGVVIDAAQERVIDASEGGALVEVTDAERLPPIGARGLARLRRGDVVIERRARVVRLRFGGRDKGNPIGRAIAVVFDDGDDKRSRALAELVRGE